MTAARLGIVLATAVDLPHARAIALAARRRRIDVALFAMADGVAALAADPAAVAELVAADCALTACATSRDAAALVLPPGIAIGSQDDHAALVATSTRLVALT